MSINQYLTDITKKYKSGIATEHTYRSYLEILIKSIVPDVDVTNEPSRVTDCGNPDYVITKRKIPIGYIEAKDIDKDLDSKGYKEQFDRYKKALDNLIITDYLKFQFFRHGELVQEIRLATTENNNIIPIPSNFTHFEDLIKDFSTFITQIIKSSRTLAEMMANKARLLQNIIEKTTESDEKTEENTSLQDQYKTFKKVLIHDLNPKDFSDIYAQTLAYGMFTSFA